jgi:hypothetical protein
LNERNKKMSIKKSHIIISLVLLSLMLAACIPSASIESVADPEDALGTMPEATPGAPEGDTPGTGSMPVAGTTADVNYAIVDTGQAVCYDNREQIACPAEGESFYGQDAQFDGNQPSYTLSADGLTVYDNITGLTWTQSPDLDSDGDIDVDDKLTFAEAQAYPATLNAANFGGYNDWRLPSIKELYSLMDFSGTDPIIGGGTDDLTPFIDTNTFAFGYGDEAAGERNIDAQFWSSNVYVGTVFNGQQATFGLNLADGRIKGYPSGTSGPMDKLNYVYFVRGNTDYGVSDFGDNGDGTITDNATGLMWSQNDSGTGMNWEDALAWVQQKNAENYLGYSDWRLPNAKELQSIVDYSRSPDATGSAAIDPVFSATQITNEAGQADYPFYWTSTTHIRAGGNGGAGVYVSFGRGLGSMDGTNVIDVHGAGCQRSDPKDGDPSNYPSWGHGPQGDMQRVFNYIRLVRGGAQAGGMVGADSEESPERGSEPPSGEGSPPQGDQPPTGGQPPVGEGLGGSPPVEAVEACNGLSEGTQCEFTSPRGTVAGTCFPVEAQLVCVPEGGPPGGNGEPPSGP